MLSEKPTCWPGGFPFGISGVDRSLAQAPRTRGLHVQAISISSYLANIRVVRFSRLLVVTFQFPQNVQNSACSCLPWNKKVNFGTYISTKSASRLNVTHLSAVHLAWATLSESCRTQDDYRVWTTYSLLRIRYMQVSGKTKAAMHGKSPAIITCSHLTVVARPQ